ncbi:MAG: VIT domain-containing protein [Pseudomonadota bacterium]
MNEELETKRPRKTVWFIVIFGVLLPIVTLALEATFRIAQGTFFDPLPTIYHGLLIAMVPLANALLVQDIVMERPAMSPAAALLHAFGMGVSLIYAIQFLPLTPIAPIAIIWFGFGFLPLAPLLSLVAAILGRKALGRMWGATPRFLWRGMALALVAYIALDTPAAVTRIGLQMATSEAPETRLRGVRWLRAIGNEEMMLRHCQPQSGMASGLLGTLLDLGSSVSPDQARKVFYQVTGTPFASRPMPPANNRYNWRNAFDEDRGGAIVGSHADGVALASSRMNGSVDANAAIGYLEWTMVFKNSSGRVQEGRAEVTLPQGAVVSRATLWIDGEEREAAFGGRGEVRAAYAKVVNQNRDPLLVTTAGPDRVLVQLFPIPAGGEMKIRIGITAPMTMRDLHRARLQLPWISERNFEIDPAQRHAVWVESKSALQGGAGLRSEQVSDKRFALRGELADPAPGLAAPAIEAARPQLATTSWSVDDKGGDDKIVVQTLTEKPVNAPRRVAIVIDGSGSMQAAQAQLVKAVASLPAAAEVAIIFAGDEHPVVVAHDRADIGKTRRYLKQLDFEGGRDNSEALGMAWDWASTTSAAIVWIHGAQLDLDDATEPLQQRFERRPGQVDVYEVEVAPGPNAIARKLDGRVAMRRVAREGELADDLGLVFGQWAPGAVQVVATRKREAAGDMEQAGKTSTQLARLWAAERVDTLSVDPKQHDAAVALASRYQLVTPVSGAVVLETKQQYDEAGLEPVAPGSVPTIPEPETWLLIIVALSVLGLRLRKRSA